MKSKLINAIGNQDRHAEDNVLGSKGRSIRIWLNELKANLVPSFVVNIHSLDHVRRNSPEISSPSFITTVTPGVGLACESQIDPY